MNVRYLPALLSLVILVMDAVEWASGWGPAAVFYLWLCSYVLVVGTVAFWLVRHFTQFRTWTLLDVATNIAAIAALAFIFYPLFVHLTLPTTVHPEAARQASCGYLKFKESLYKAMYSWCFLGYNTRQYLPQALVREYFGAGPIQLNITYFAYLLVGYIAFWLGLEKMRQRGFGGSLLLLTALVLPLQSYFFFFLSYANEQSVFPLALTLLLFGAIMMFANTLSVWNLGIILLLLQWLVFSYTPAVSVLFLGVALVMLLVAYRKEIVPRNKVIATLLALATVAQFGISFAHRNDIKLAHENKVPFVARFMETYPQLLRSLLSDSTFADVVYSSRYSVAVVVLAFLVLLWRGGRARLPVLVVAGWSVAHLLIAAYSKGYAAPPVPFSLHRATPLLPVCSLAVFFGLGLLRGKLPRLGYVTLCLCVLGLHLFLAEERSASYRQRVAETRASIPITSGELLSDLVATGDLDKVQHITLGLFFEKTHSIQVFPDVASFYLPDVPWTRTLLPTIPAEYKTSPTFWGLYISGKADEFVCDPSFADEGRDFMVIKQIPLKSSAYASNNMVACFYAPKIRGAGEVGG